MMSDTDPRVAPEPDAVLLSKIKIISKFKDCEIFGTHLLLFRYHHDFLL